MAAIKDTLLDKDENEIYPKTVTDNVFDSEGNRLDNLIGSIKEKLDSHLFGETVNLMTYTSNVYIFPTDGYLVIGADYGNHYIYYELNGVFGAVSSVTSSSNFNMIYVKKGMSFKVNRTDVSSGIHANFCPLT